MNVYDIMLILTLMMMLFFGLLIALLRHRIMSFFKPQDYCIIEMLEKDNSASQWLQHKDKNLEFNFNDGTYNMFESVPGTDETKDEKKIPTDEKGTPLPPNITPDKKDIPIRNFTSIYREGRLAKLYYIEGEKNPIDFRHLRINDDAQQSLQLEKVQISRLIHKETSLGSELWRKFGFFIMLGIGALLLFILFKK